MLSKVSKMVPCFQWDHYLGILNHHVRNPLFSDRPANAPGRWHLRILPVGGVLVPVGLVFGLSTLFEPASCLRYASGWYYLQKRRLLPPQSRDRAQHHRKNSRLLYNFHCNQGRTFIDDLATTEKSVDCDQSGFRALYSWIDCYGNL